MRLRLPEVRPGERRNTTGSFLILFGTMIGHSLLETARDALFLAEIESRQLPFVYLGIAGLAFAISSFQGHGTKRGLSRIELSAWLAGAGLVTFAVWSLLARGGTWILYVLYVWSGLLSTLLIVRFWIVAGNLFSVTQAKRLFAIVGTGSILGAIAGSAAARFLVVRAPDTTLLLAASGVFLVTALLPGVLRFEESEPGRPRRAEPAEPRDLLATLRGVRSHPYVARIAAIVIVSTVTLTLVDLVFKSEIARTTAPEDLGEAFALTYLLLNSAAFLIQLFLVGWMTRNLGIDKVLGFLPVTLLAGALWLVLGGALYAAYVLKAFDGFFRHSLHRTATEVLYVPLSEAWRSRAKGLIDVVGQRGGQAIASLVFLSAAVFGSVNLVIGIALLALCALWIFLTTDIKRHYFNLFRTTLRDQITQTRIDFPEMDLASLETLMAALSSPDEREVNAALDLLAEKDRVRLVPALILYHPSPSVVVRALELFRRAGRSDHLRLTDRLFDHPDESVRVAALVTVRTDDEDAARFEKALDDESPLVRATALVGLIASRADVHPRVRSILDTLLLAGSSQAKQALARAIRHRPHTEFDGVLRSLATHPDPAVGREVALAMRESPKSIYIQSLLQMLRWRETRGEARETLLAIGEPALEQLASSLDDSSLEPSIRRHVPRTISRFEPARAGPILLSRLPIEEDGVTRFKILRALGYLRSRNPGLRLDTKILDSTVQNTLEAIFRLIHWRITLERASRSNPEWNTPVHELIVELLAHKETLAIARLFRLFGLQYPREDFRRIHRGLEAGDRQAKASSRELLEHVLGSPVREAVLGLLDDTPDGQRLTQGRRFYEPPHGSPEDVLKTLLEQRSAHLRCLVAYHVAEIGLRDLRDDLAALCDEAVGAMESSLENSLQMLDDPAQEKAFVVHLR